MFNKGFSHPMCKASLQFELKRRGGGVKNWETIFRTQSFARFRPTDVWRYIPAKIQLLFLILSLLSEILRYSFTMRHCSFTMRNSTSSFQILVYILSSQSEILHWSFTMRNSTSSFTDSSLHFIFAVRNSTFRVSHWCDFVSFAIRQRHLTIVIRYASLVIHFMQVSLFNFRHAWMINDVLFQRETAVLARTQINTAEDDREYREHLRQVHITVRCITVNQVSMVLENITNPFEIDGLVLRLDYLMRTLVNQGIPRTDEITAWGSLQRANCNKRGSFKIDWWRCRRI